MNGNLVSGTLVDLRQDIDDHPDIMLLDNTFDRTDTLALIAACDAVLSLHRSEGLGLLLAEAMLLDKPVIATGYSATHDFLSEQTGYPVGYRLVPVRDGDYPVPDGQFWAEADVAHAAWLMQRLQRDPAIAVPLIAQGRNHVQ